MFVDAQDAGRGALGVGFAQHFLALQHHGEDVADVLGVVFLLLDQAAQQVFRALLFEGVRFFVGDRGPINGFPEGEGLGLVRAAGLPGIQREVLAQVAGGFGVGKERGHDGFAVFEGSFGRGASAGAGADVPGFG